MGYTRAGWHSGLTYQQTCEQCKTTVRYMDNSLDFRPWFADGFVYCPVCKKPLRHKEEYALDKIEPQFVDMHGNNSAQSDNTERENHSEGFCTQCGKAFREGDRFCSGCGTKRD